MDDRITEIRQRCEEGRTVRITDVKELLTEIDRLTNSQWDEMPKVVPDECYEKYGTDLDGCSTQQNEGCGRCKCKDERVEQ